MLRSLESLERATSRTSDPELDPLDLPFADLGRNRQLSSREPSLLPKTAQLCAQAL